MYARRANRIRRVVLRAENPSNDIPQAGRPACTRSKVESRWVRYQNQKRGIRHPPRRAHHGQFRSPEHTPCRVAGRDGPQGNPPILERVRLFPKAYLQIDNDSPRILKTWLLDTQVPLARPSTSSMTEGARAATV